MKAIMMYKPGDARLIDIKTPKPKEKEVLMKVKECGVCGTDDMLYRGVYYANFPIIFGHEYSGEVIEFCDPRIETIKRADRTI